LVATLPATIVITSQAWNLALVPSGLGAAEDGAVRLAATGDLPQAVVGHQRHCALHVVRVPWREEADHEGIAYFSMDGAYGSPLAERNALSGYGSCQLLFQAYAGAKATKETPCRV